VFLGIVPRAEYETPGGKTFAETIRPFIGKANTVVLSNHGTVSWGPTVEKAYWYTEILDAYCRILLLAEQMGNVQRLPIPKMKELLALKERFGAGVDPRRSLTDAEMCVNTEFGRGFASGAPAACGPASPSAGSAPRADEFEELVRAITARVVETMRQG
jgi:L-fuculose-phosphate aldolase